MLTYAYTYTFQELARVINVLCSVLIYKIPEVVIGDHGCHKDESSCAGEVVIDESASKQKPRTYNIVCDGIISLLWARRGAHIRIRVCRIERSNICWTTSVNNGGEGEEREKKSVPVIA